MKILMDDKDLMHFAEQAVEAQKALELELINETGGFHRAPWDYKWGIVARRALGAMP